MNFDERVYSIASGIPRGRVTTYGEVARALGNRHLARAVGGALNRNRRIGIMPCHRVVSSDGRLGGFSRGTKEKERMLACEGVSVRRGRVVDFDSLFYRFGDQFL